MTALMTAKAPGETRVDHDDGRAREARETGPRRAPCHATRSTRRVRARQDNNYRTWQAQDVRCADRDQGAGDASFQAPQEYSDPIYYIYISAARSLTPSIFSIAKIIHIRRPVH